MVVSKIKMSRCDFNANIRFESRQLIVFILLDMLMFKEFMGVIGSTTTSVSVKHGSDRRCKNV